MERTSTALPAFQELTARIKDRCEELPVTVELHDVGNYRLFPASEASHV